MVEEIIPDLHRKKTSRTAWIKRFLEHGPFCHYCQIRLTLDTAIKEHLTPLCRGGADTAENMAPSCAICNDMKAWRTEAEFMRDRSMLLARRTAARTIAPLELRTPSMEERIEPGLLKTLIRERDKLPSYWWRSA